MNTSSSKENIKKQLSKITRSMSNYIKSEIETGTKDIYFSKNISPNSDKRKELEKVFEDIRRCQRCGLYKQKKNYVVGEGSPGAELMFIGEAPGYEEDLQGRPFVGRAGQLLTKIIEAIDLKRSQVFIANLLRCRPPENRNPLPEEIEKCKGYLYNQIDIINPKVICALGKFSAQVLLGSAEPISALRGRFYNFKAIKVMPTFHPAYLLRNPSAKKEAWEDMKKIRELLKK